MKIVPKEKALACPSSSGAFNWGYEVIDLGWVYRFTVEKTLENPSFMVV